MVSATVKLYKDIGLDPGYHKTMLFDTKSAQQTWFNSKVSKTLSDVNYNKLQNTFAIHEDYGNVYQYTYVSIHDMDDSGRIYYGFVSAITLIDEETTRFDIVLDPVQTFMTEWSVGESLVVREHCDRWDSTALPVYVTPNQENVNGFNNVTTALVSSSSDYSLGIIGYVSTIPYIDSTGKKIPTENASRVEFCVVPLKISNPTEQLYVKIESNGKYYAVKMPTMAEFVNGSVINKMGGNPESCIGIWILPQSNIEFLTSTAEDEEGTTHDCINVWNLPAKLSIEDSAYAYDNEVALIVNMESFTSYDVTCMQIATRYMIELFYEIEKNIISVPFNAPTKPSSATATASDTYEPALYFAPYRTRGICKQDGVSLIQLPDNVYARSPSVQYLQCRTNLSSDGCSEIITLCDKSTEMSPAERQKYGNEGATAIDMAVAVDNVSNNWLSYCLTQRDSDRDVTKSAMITNAITNMVGMGYGGALVGSRANSGRNDGLRGGTEASAPVQYKGGFSKAMMSAVGFGVGAAAVTSIVQGIDMWNQQMAKEQSIRNQPNTLLSIGSGTPMLYDNNSLYYKYETKVDDVNYNKAYRNFRYYGYMVNRMEVPNIKSRYYFNYICTMNTVIEGNLPADVKQSLVDILERGITFFHGDHCTSTTYPTYENIERSII